MTFGSETRAWGKIPQKYHKYHKLNIFSKYFNMGQNVNFNPPTSFSSAMYWKYSRTAFLLSLYCYVYRSWIGSWMNSLSCAPNCESHPLICLIQNPPQPGAWPFSAACRPSRPVHSGVSIITAPVKINTGSPGKPNGSPITNQTG